MSGVFCAVAMALGLSFGGICVPEAPAARSELPADDENAWTVPPPPPPPAPAPPPAMPPIIIRQEVERLAPPPPSAALPAPARITVAPAPRPDPWRAALEAAWRQPVALAPGWDAPAWTRPALVPASAEARTGLGSPAALSAPAVPTADLLQLASLPPPADYEGPRRTSTRPVDNRRIVAADRYITGILETGINSQIGSGTGGAVIIQTARDVFGYHDRLVLIPKGSRLICDYEAPEDMGSSRLAIVCTRLLAGGHRAEIRELGSGVGDVQGRQGVTGEVDRRFWERYGTAFLLTGLSTMVRFASASTQSEAAAGTVATAAAEKAAEELSSQFGQVTASVLEQSLSLTPIITIPQGTRVQIRPATDWYIAQPE